MEPGKMPADDCRDCTITRDAEGRVVGGGSAFTFHDVTRGHIDANGVRQPNPWFDPTQVG